MIEKIHLSSAHGELDGTFDSTGGPLEEEYICYICKAPAVDFGDYFLGGAEPIKGLKDFRKISKELGISYKVDDPHWARICISTCKDHIPNLNKLELSIKENDDFLTKEILENSLK